MERGLDPLSNRFDSETSLILVCLMLVVSVITGLVLSRAAMRPVRLIRETANHIRSDNLSERIPVADVQDELSNLVRLPNEMFDRLELSFNQIRRFTAEASHELKPRSHSCGCTRENCWSRAD